MINSTGGHGTKNDYVRRSNRTQPLERLHMKKNLTTQFTIDLLKSAVAEGVRFGVVRGVETVDAPPGDADIISPDRNGIRDFIRKYCARNGAVILPTISRHYVDIYRILAKDQDGRYFTAKIDVHNSEQWRGMVYLNSGDATNKLRMVDGVPRVSPVHSVIANIMQIALPGGKVFSSRSARIEAAINQFNDDDLQELKAYFDQIGAPEVFHFLVKRDFDSAAQHIFVNRGRIWLHIFSRSPAQTVFNLVMTAWRKLVYLVAPPGIFIAIVGPDGAGKSTLISAIQNTVGIWTAKELIRVQHWRPGFLKPLAAYRRVSWTPAGANEHQSNGLAEVSIGGSRAPFFSSLMRYIYYIFDYTLGYWFVSRRILAQEGIVICDRYVDDYIIAPEVRSRIGLPMLAKRIIARIVPRPSHKFYLRGKPDLLYSRKSEETFDELVDLVHQYDFHCRPDRGFVILDAATPVVEIRDIVLKRLLRCDS